MLRKLWRLGRKEVKVVWQIVPVPTDFNQSQLDCVSNARWLYKEMRSSIVSGQEMRTDRVASCFWFIVFSHFSGFIDVHSGYSLDLTVPRIIERTRTAMDKVLLPKLEEIIRCDDQKKKALLAYQYIYILMAAVFDSSTAAIHYSVLREVLDVPALDLIEKEHIRENRGKFLEPLGFQPHKWTEDGEEYTTWYWPR